MHSINAGEPGIFYAELGPEAGATVLLAHSRPDDASACGGVARQIARRRRESGQLQQQT